jgi:hypothetical protein
MKHMTLEVPKLMLANFVNFFIITHLALSRENKHILMFKNGQGIVSTGYDILVGKD